MKIDNLRDVNPVQLQHHFVNQFQSCFFIKQLRLFDFGESRTGSLKLDVLILQTRSLNKEAVVRRFSVKMIFLKIS